MKKLMKKGFTLGMALMFLVSIVPAAFAQEDTDATETNMKYIDASSGRVTVKKVEPKLAVGFNPNTDIDPIVVNPISIRPIAITDRGSVGHTFKKIDDDVEKSKRRSKIKNSIKHYRKKIKYLMSDKFLEEENYNGEKAARFLVFSTLLTERAIDFLDHVETRAENSPKFLENHPNALENIAERREKLAGIYEGLYTTVSDGGLSEMGLTSLDKDLYQEVKETYLISLGKELKSIAKNKYILAYRKHNKDKVVKKLKTSAKKWKKKYGADKIKGVEVEIERYETTGNIDAVKTEITKLVAVDVKPVILEDKDEIEEDSN